MFKIFKRKAVLAEPAQAGAAAVLESEDAEQVLRRLEWTVIRRLDGLLQGDYRTLSRGSGIDLADLREYQHHDDVRHIDWNVTARLQVPHVRVFTEDRDMTAWFLLDLSPSVDFGSGEKRKQSISSGFVAVLARLLTRHGNRVGAILYGSGVDRVIPVGSGRQHVLQLIHSMAQRSKVKDLGATRLADLLNQAVGIVRRRSTVFVISDFISEPGWEKPLAMLTQKHEVIAVRLFDPLESNLPDLGLITMRDAESGEQLLVDTSSAKFRQRFAQIAVQHEVELRQSLSRVGVDTLELSTDDDLVQSILRFTDMRKRRSRVAVGGKLPIHLKLVA
jgi:uncharacterized protein (DUF58 family)